MSEVPLKRAAETVWDLLGLDTSDIMCLMHRITYDPASPRLAAT